MAGQPQWRLIDQTLDRVYLEIVKHPAFTDRSGGPSIDDTSYREHWAKLDRHGRILKTALQSLKNSGNLLHLQTLAARRIPREHRYQVNQSLRARQSNLEHVHQKAETILQMLSEMEQGSGGPSLSSLKDLFEQGEKALHALISDPPEFPQPGFNAPPAAGAVLPFHTVIALIVYYLLYRNRGR